MVNTFCKKINSKDYGTVHSIESLGALDGPGLRTVIFMQGCPLKCKFCHNVDSTLIEGGEKYTVDELVEKVIKNKEYWKSTDDSKITGGVTFSGGEPTFQYEFVSEVAKKLKTQGIHITIDTSLFCSKKAIDKLFPHVDYWMISIKHLNNTIHKDLTGVPNTIILRNLSYIDDLISKSKKKNIRIRFILIPTITDSEEYLNELGAFAKNVKSLDFVEILPYSSIGKYKWINLFGYYPFEIIREANGEDMKNVLDILGNYCVIKY